MSVDSWVIKFARSDQGNQPILVRVSRKSGGYALDLDLLATDGENAYRAKGIRDRRLDKLKSARYDGTSEEWSNILQHVLYSPTCASTNITEKLRDTLDFTCFISENGRKSNLNITIRQSVEGITHQFGSITLPQSDDTDDVDLFGWAFEVANERDSLAAQLKSSNVRVESAETTIKNLQNQLSELVKAKEEHETHLLSKFALLINEKKLRIRAQQRQIRDQYANLDYKSVPKTKRAQKRKASEHDISEEASESDAFDAMDVEQGNIAAEFGSDDVRTSSAQSDPESEPEFADSMMPASSKLASRSTTALPPPRELPFEDKSRPSKGTPRHQTQEQPILDDDETASEDEEL